MIKQNNDKQKSEIEVRNDIPIVCSTVKPKRSVIIKERKDNWLFILRLLTRN